MPAIRSGPLLALLLLALMRQPIAALAGDDAYRAEVEQFRRRREGDLKSADGWLSVVGLHWLSPGRTRLGSDPSSDILLPPGAPSSVGTIDLDGDRATFRAAPGVKVSKAGAPFESGEIRSDAGGKPDVLAAGDIRLILLRRGRRFAIRVKDPGSEARRRFAGLRWYPVDPSWKVEARFVPAPENTRLVFDTIVGEQETAESPGFVVFERDGKSYRLQAAAERDGSLWIVFRDGTSGRTTAGGARQLEAARPGPDGAVVLDFNRATNLPCAYIPFATCPLAPPQNRLPLPIAAGELKYEADSSRP
ncbi:hypothetical protein OJF2_59880 [Aquisphaera giovannonii]|uniref:DUF1684 domain-containing protein n=1 Tax=Aquisphaera giovannonii TaxID=406548 RepID=A0A5B9WAC6_9BACT|nr:DUF1684 domain-containing protein [Aquisphaera giovannonii]QEH37397.1 hypothetical protein OJF2_59880 [Aquisphaera giovannonii]